MNFRGDLPAIVSLTLLDGNGRERLYVSRIGLNRTETRTDRSADEAVAGARSNRLWYGKVSYYRDSEPYMTVAISGNRPSVGVVVAEVNLKLIWDVISTIRIGQGGCAYVVDQQGRVMAHPDIGWAARRECLRTRTAVRLGKCILPARPQSSSP